MKNLEKNIWKLKWLGIFQGTFIAIPILTVFFLSKGLDMREVFIIQSFFASLVLVGEVPSGYFADKFGRKLSIVTGILIWYIAIVFYPFGVGFWYYMMIEGLLGIGVSLLSGADSALLYDSLYSLGKKDEYHKIESNNFAWLGYFLSVASILGGFLASYSLEYPFYAQIFFMFFTIPLALSLKEAPMHMHVVGEEIKGMKNIIIHYLHKHKEVKWLIIFYGFLGSSTLASIWFAQPFWQSVSLPLSLFGIIWAFMTFFRALSTKISPTLNEKLTRKNLFLLLISLVFSGFIGLAIFDKFIGASLFMINFQLAFGIARPLFKKYINELVPSKIRATVLSLNSMFQRLVFVILGPIIGYLFDIFAFREAFLINGTFFFVVGIYSIIMMKKYRLL